MNRPVNAKPLGVSELKSSSLAYGCWRIADAGDTQAGLASVMAAYEAGYTLFDNADIYGGGMAEELLGRALQEVPGMRERIVLLTKCGVRRPGQPSPDSPHRYDLSAEHIVASCEGSLRRLNVETIDIYMLHRADYLVSPAEVARAFGQLKTQGKARFFAVSNFRPTLLTALQAACPMPILAHEFEFSLTRLHPLEDGTLDQCLIERVTPLAWSPLGGGLLADMRHPAGVIPIVGSVQPDRIRDATKADGLQLSRDEWYRLLLAARGQSLD